MLWKDVFNMLVSGKLEANKPVIVYDKETGEEHSCDLIEFEDTGEIAIVINEDVD